MSALAREAGGHEENAVTSIARREWKQILLGAYRSISDDRVLAVAAGVTFYGLLAVFPAIGAVVSLYGLFADSATIRDTLDQLSSLLPGGAIEVVGDQIQRVSAAGNRTLSFSFLLSLVIAIWGANAGVKAIFDAINVAYGAREERGFFRLNLISLAFTMGAIVFALLALTAVVALPISFHYLGLDAAFEALLRYGRWPLIWLVVALGLAFLYRFGPTDLIRSEMAMDQLGQRVGRHPLARRFRTLFLVCSELWQLQYDLRLAWCGDRLHDLDVALGCRHHHGRRTQRRDRKRCR